MKKESTWSVIHPDGRLHICSGYKTCGLVCQFKTPHEFNDACEAWCNPDGTKYRMCRHVFKKEEVMFRMTGKYENLRLQSGR
jgi:hypothetical protein